MDERGARLGALYALIGHGMTTADGTHAVGPSPGVRSGVATLMLAAGASPAVDDPAGNVAVTR